MGMFEYPPDVFYNQSVKFKKIKKFDTKLQIPVLGTINFYLTYVNIYLCMSAQYINWLIMYNRGGNGSCPLALGAARQGAT